MIESHSIESPEPEPEPRVELAADPSAAGPRAASPTARRFAWAIGIGFIVTAAVLIVPRIIQGNGYVVLDRPGFEAAVARWRSRAPADYDIRIDVTGRQAASYRVEVRDGEPIAAYRNDHPLPQRRSWMTWTVPGIFGTVESDLRQLESAERGEPGIPGLSVLVLFDPRYGIPTRYVRAESASGSPNPEVTWEVTRFSIPGSTDPP
ncbi:MAG: hypothetical protein FJ297_09340 [Planctomycetes bacterium]|nr:hypothetical protein [Planctomycetota bacterium]